MDNNEMNAAIASIIKDKSKREALAQIITEWVQPGRITVDFVSMLLDSRSLQPGDSLLKKVRKGVKVMSLIPGSIPLKHEITVSERANYALNYANVAVTASEWDLANGNIGTVGEIRSEMMIRLKEFYQNKVFTALSTIWSAVNTPDNYTSVGGNITATALKNAIDHVVAKTGGVQAVVGVRELMTPITEFGAFWEGTPVSTATREGVPSQLEKVMQDGFLGKYYGAPLN